MAHTRVECDVIIDASADAVWQVAGQFTQPWHPAMASCTHAPPGEHSGAVVRRFTIHGEDTLYVERQTFRSNTCRRLDYVALAGITGIDSYTASLRVESLGCGRAKAYWCADIEAPADRVTAVADGTRVVFDTGLNFLRSLNKFSSQSSPTSSAPSGKPGKVTAHQYLLMRDRSAQIAFDYMPNESSDTLCIFVHGIGGGRGNWRPQLSVAAQVMTAAAIDLRGYGESTLGPHPSSIDSYCEDIRAVADHFAAQRIVLIGLSYGAWIATSFALRHPEYMAGLVICGGCTGMSEAAEGERHAFRAAREVPLNNGQTPADFAPAVIDVIAGPNCSTSVRSELLHSMAAIAAATYRDALNCFTHPTEQFDLGQLACPCLAMTGEFDKLAPPAEIQAVAERMGKRAKAKGWPDVTFEVIPGAGHVANLENESFYNTELSGFLDRVGDIY